MTFDELETMPCLNLPATVCTPEVVPEPTVVPPVITDDYLIIKPSYVIKEPGQFIQFKLFMVRGDTGEEIEVSSGATWTSSNEMVAVVGASSGNTTAIMEGFSVISASLQSMTASAQMDVVGDCSDIVVAMALMIDNSKSMSSVFTNEAVSGQPSFSTRLNAAKTMAKELVGTLNLAKDYAGVGYFNGSMQSFVDFVQDESVLDSAVTNVPPGTSTTDYVTSMTQAVAEINSFAAQHSEVQRRVLIVFTDGDDNGDEDAEAYFDQVKESGIIVIMVGFRASVDGFRLLRTTSNEGLFLNALPSNYAESSGYLISMKGLFCAGNCSPPRGFTTPTPALNVGMGDDSLPLTQWDILRGWVDLIGDGGVVRQFDFLPGNGMYLDLSGSGGGVGIDQWKAIIQSKLEFTLDVGSDYQIRFKLAGNQRRSGTDVVTVDFDVATVDITITDYMQDFTEYTLDIAAGTVTSGKLKITYKSTTVDGSPFAGPLLDEVILERLDGLGVADKIVFYDNFDSENPVTYSDPCNPIYATGDRFCIDLGFTGQVSDWMTGVAKVGEAADIWNEVLFPASTDDAVTTLIWSDGLEHGTLPGNSPFIICDPTQAGLNDADEGVGFFSVLPQTYWRYLGPQQSENTDLSACMAGGGNCKWIAVCPMAGGFYDIYVYGAPVAAQSEFRVGLCVSSQTPGSFVPTLTFADIKQNSIDGTEIQFTEGSTYVKWSDVYIPDPTAFFTPILYFILFAPHNSVDGYGYISGMQIVRKDTATGDAPVTMLPDGDSVPASGDYDDCYGEGCMTEPPPEQIQDPNPLADTED